jgi:hypothetical protein
MTAKLLSEKAFSVINHYKNFTTGFAVCSIPYFNNRRDRARAKLRAQAGKGSPQEILDEAESVATHQKINLKALDSLSLKKFLVDSNIGIDCSGLAYYILNAEMESRGKGRLKLSYPYQKGPIGFLRALLRPIENTDVATLAHDRNSRQIELKYIQPGDMITMVGGPDNNDRDHVLVVHEVDYKDDVVAGISYTHTVAWPTDGVYAHGVRQGTIRIIDIEKPITEQDWLEAEMTGSSNYTFTRATKSKTEIRRLNWL